MNTAINASDMERLQRQQFIDAMSLAANGVTVVTTSNQGAHHGATVSAMCSVTADTPTLLICLFRGSQIANQIDITRSFAVNLLNSEQQLIAQRFASRENEQDRFSQEGWSTLETGAPILNSSVAAFDCEVVEQLEQGSHCIYIAKVVASSIHEQSQGKQALVYSQRGYCQLSH